MTTTILLLSVFDLVHPAVFGEDAFAAVLIDRGFLVDRLGGRLFASRESAGGELLQLVARCDELEWRVYFAAGGRGLAEVVADAPALHRVLDRRVPRHLQVYAGGRS